MNGEGPAEHPGRPEKVRPRLEMASFRPWKPLVSSSDRISTRVPFSSLATERASQGSGLGSKSREIAL